MIAATISDAYLAPLIAASFVAVLGLMAWIVKGLIEVTRTLTKHDGVFDLHNQRIATLERELGDLERQRWRS